MDLIIDLMFGGVKMADIGGGILNLRNLREFLAELLWFCGPIVIILFLTQQPKLTFWLFKSSVSVDLSFIIEIRQNLTCLTTLF